MGSRGGDHTPGQSLPLGWEGTDVPVRSEDPSPGPPGTATAVARSRRPRRLRRILALGAALLLVGVLTVGLPRLLTVTIGPELAVSDFLQAVVDGDLEQVRAHIEEAPHASGAALTAELMRSATGGIESFEIEDIRTRAGTATVTALLRGGDSAGTATFTLTALSTSAFAPVTWELAPVALPEAVIDVPLGVQELQLNGIRFPLEELAPDSWPSLRQVSVQLLPGRYEVSPVLPGPWRDVPPRSVEVPLTFGHWHGTVRTPPVGLTVDAQQQVSRLVDEHLHRCLTTPAEVLKGCPMPHGQVEAEPAGKEAASAGAWELVEDPALEIEPSPNGVKWLMRGTGAARLAGADGEEPSETVPVTFYGDIYVTGNGEMRYRPESSDGTVSHFYTACFDAETGEMSAITRSVLEGGIWRWEGDRCE